MRIINFANRNIKELLRDPMSIIFSVILPLVFLIIFQQFNIPLEQYSIENFTPGIIIFSFSFISLFTASLIAKDRSTSFLSRLFSSPMKSYEYILGYTLALVPITLLQSILFFIVGTLYGLPFSIKIILTTLILIPIAILFVGLGLLVGCISSEKAAGPLGSIIVQFVSFTSGMWFSISIAGKAFKFICQILPFSACVDITKAVLKGDTINIESIIIILIYIVIINLIATILFKDKMNSNNK